MGVNADRFYKLSLLTLMLSILSATDPFIPKYDTILALGGVILTTRYTHSWMLLYKFYEMICIVI